MSDTSDKSLIRFDCPSCQTSLAVDRALAGKDSPCQSCGALVTVPPLDVSMTLSEKQAAPLAIQPRIRSRKRAPSSPFELVNEGDGNPNKGDSHASKGRAHPDRDRSKASRGRSNTIMGSRNSTTKSGSNSTAVKAAAPTLDRTKKQARQAGQARSVNPATMLSQSHEDKKNIRAFITITIVTLVVACLALGVYYFMVYGQY